MKFVYIKWLDAQSLDPWTHETDIKPALAEIVSVGILISRDKNITSIAVNRDTTNQCYSCVMNIPSNCITEFKLLTEK